MLDLVELGETVRAARLERGMTATELAARSGLSRQRLHAFEKGTGPEIGVIRLQRILNVVGLDLRLGTLTTNNRPTLEDLRAENAKENSDAPGLG
jgi:Predicted transcriptional regulators